MLWGICLILVFSGTASYTVHLGKIPLLPVEDRFLPNAQIDPRASVEEMRSRTASTVPVSREYYLEAEKIALHQGLKRVPGFVYDPGVMHPEDFTPEAWPVVVDGSAGDMIILQYGLSFIMLIVICKYFVSTQIVYRLISLIIVVQQVCISQDGYRQ